MAFSAFPRLCNHLEALLLEYFRPQKETHGHSAVAPQPPPVIPSFLPPPGPAAPISLILSLRPHLFGVFYINGGARCPDPGKASSTAHGALRSIHVVVGVGASPLWPRSAAGTDKPCGVTLLPGGPSGPLRLLVTVARAAVSMRVYALP